MSLNPLLLIPEYVLLGGALGVMLWDLWLPADKKGVLTNVSMALCAVLFGLTFLPSLQVTDAPLEAFGGTFVVDKMALLMKRAFAICGFLYFVISREYIAGMTRGKGEFCTLSLLSLLGMFVVSSVGDFMSMFVALEIVTVAFFVLAAYKRTDGTSVEAGLKLLVVGSVSAAFLLYGIAFVYGAVGSVEFDEVRKAMAGPGFERPETLLLVGALMIFLGLGFKTSAVPLHVWVPDVYQGAPTPVTAFLSVGSKLAGFVLVLRCVDVFSGALASEMTYFFGLVAALTLFYGNLGAIPQSNIKRLMGYSSIGQCGYLLVGIAAYASGGISAELGLSGVLFYMTAYVVTNLAAFAVILIVGRAVGTHDLSAYAGLWKRSPLLALTLTTALLSLAGVPPFIGFFGKFMLVGSAFGIESLQWVAVCALINVVIALYYYLTVIKRIFVHDAPNPAAPTVQPSVKFAMITSVIVLIGCGIAPMLLEEPTRDVARDDPVVQRADGR